MINKINIEGLLEKLSEWTTQNSSDRNVRIVVDIKKDNFVVTAYEKYQKEEE